MRIKRLFSRFERKPAPQVPGRIDKNLLSSYPYKISWDLNTFCNFRCSYCFYDHEALKAELPGVARFSPRHIRKCFDRTHREWLILISGGEPFLYPGFVTLARQLTKKHFIQVTTNLSTKNVVEFADIVPPERVMAISASLHILQRESTTNGYHHFVDRCLYLQEKGFPLLVNYVAFPPLLQRIRNDIAQLKANGIMETTVLTFRGEFGGQVYPDAYSQEQLELIREFAVDDFEYEIATRNTRFYGRHCEAGHAYFKLDPLGNLFRCLTIFSESYGNLFTGEYSFGSAAKPCTAAECHDCYVGSAAVSSE